MAYYGVLHTDTGYAESYALPNKNYWDKFAISFLAGQENKLYATLGASNFTDFMNKIHELLDEAEGIRDILKNFKKGNLVKYFDLPEILPLANQEIHLDCTGAKNISLKELFAGLSGDNFTVSVSGDEITFTYNHQTAKELMNVLEGRTDRNKFQVNTPSMDRVNRAFKQWINKETNLKNLVEIQINGKPVDVHMVTQTTDRAKNLFGLKQKDLDKALKEDPQLKQQLISMRWNVYNELSNLCGNNFELQQAFNIAWKNKMGDINDRSDGALNKFIFLSKGGNLNAGVSGAIQEMYGAIITEYLALISKKHIPEKLVEIIGNIIEGEAEQPKADLVLLQQIGIQVKAYGMDNVIKHMEANLHPDALDAQLRPYGAVNIGDAIVQSVFNTDNESPDSFAFALRDYAAALLNLATSKNLDVRNTVCFYLIDAQYLVPGSKILEAFDTQQSEYDVKITSSYHGKSSSEYAEKTYLSNNAYKYKTRRTTRLSPGFMEFFDKAGQNPIEPDSKNESLYTLLYTSHISIRTVFDYGFAGSDVYKIF